MNNDFFDKIDNNKKQDNHNRNTDNKIANILRVIGWIELVVSFILGFVIGTNSDGDLVFSITLIAWGVGGISALLIFAFAEIIQILHDIRIKMNKK